MKKIFTFISVAVLALSGLCAKESVVVLRSTAALYEEKDSKTVKYASDITAGTPPASLRSSMYVCPAGAR